MNKQSIVTGLLVGSILLAGCSTGQSTNAPAATATTAVVAEATPTTAVASAINTEVMTTTDTATTTEVTTNTEVTTTTDTTTMSTTEDATPAIVAAANAFLATLNDSEKATVLFDWSDTAQKQRWSNFPPAGFQRDGLMWGDMSADAQNAWLAVLQTTLSTEGYNRFLAEWQADDALYAQEGTGGGFGTDNYFIAIIGTPSATDPWQWQFGGHHVTINATIAGTNVALTPSFIGCQPCTYTDASGNTVRPLGDIEDEALALVNSLDATQQQAAILGNSAINLVLGPGQDGKSIPAEGLNAAQMTADQQAALLKLVGHYTGLVNDEDAAVRMEEIKSTLDQTYFAWYGSTASGSAFYFRVSSPTIVMEFSPQGNGGPGGGNSSATDMHVHGIYRDPSNDYGAKYLQ